MVWQYLTAAFDLRPCKSLIINAKISASRLNQIVTVKLERWKGVEFYYVTYSISRDELLAALNPYESLTSSPRDAAMAGAKGLFVTTMVTR